jgi:enamine deaminase RidA (YjgF/YER057c/UK114 family)
MHRDIVNPWTWQDPMGFVQAQRISGAQRILVCAGQASMSAEGEPLHAGDMRAQLQQTLDNLETVLKQAGFGLGDVVRLTTYTTSIDQYFAAYQEALPRLTSAGCRPASTLVEVRRLALPELMVEIEATALV